LILVVDYIIGLIQSDEGVRVACRQAAVESVLYPADDVGRFQAGLQ